MTLKLIIGNKNYSSWSMRPWIAMKVAGIPFDETVISLYVEGSEGEDQGAFRRRQGADPDRRSGNAKCACGNRSRSSNTWRTNSPTAGFWPSDPAARAHARAISTEMHAGFVPLRSECAMNMWRPPAKRASAPTPGERRAHCRDLDRDACALRRGRAVPVRQVLRRRRDVCADRLALRDLRGRRRARRSRPICRR